VEFSEAIRVGTTSDQLAIGEYSIYYQIKFGAPYSNIEARYDVEWNNSPAFTVTIQELVVDCNY
jgi:hypothetical protein